MTWIAVAVTGAAAIGGAALQADAAGDATQAGADASAAQIAQANQFRKQDLALSAPYIQTGYNALNALNSMAGLPGVEYYSPYDQDSLGGKKYDWDESSTGDSLLKFRKGDDVSLHPTLHGNAFDTDNDFWNYFQTSGGFQEFYDKFGNKFNDGKARDWLNQWSEDRWRGKVKDSNYAYSLLTGNKNKLDNWAQLNQAPNPEDRKTADGLMQPGSYQWQTDPGYAFRLAEGEKALERRQAAGGSYLSGASLKAATQYGQEFASNEFNNIFNRLSVLAGYGPTGLAQSKNPGAQSGMLQGIGNAGAYQASGTVARGNAWANGLNELAKAAGSAGQWWGKDGSSGGGTNAGWTSYDWSQHKL